VQVKKKKEQKTKKETKRKKTRRISSVNPAAFLYTQGSKGILFRLNDLFPF
jgi:hypothetical protein